MIDIILGALCEPRSDAHIEAHGGLKADTYYHMQRGEKPTCDKDGKAYFGGESSRDDSNGPGVWRRDEPGFHCTLVWGCG